MQKKRINKIVLIVSLLVCSVITSQSLPTGTFTHYSEQDGLTQSLVSDIVQDKKGYLWLGTFDGLYRFNGYEFQNFKISSSNSFIARSNRVDKIYEDKYGRLWLKSPDEVYSFNTATEMFWSLKLLDEFSDLQFSNVDIQISNSGKIWLLIEDFGCVCIEDSLYNTTTYTTANGKLQSNEVTEVHEDANGNTWLLTMNGLVMISPNKDTPIEYVLNSSIETPELHKPFLSVYESEHEIWFGSTNGKIWQYAKASKTFVEINLPVKIDLSFIEKIDDERLIFLTRNHGFYVYTIKTEKFSVYNASTLPMLHSNRVELVYPYKGSQIWFTTEEIGIYKLELSSNKLKHFFVPVDDNTIYTMPPNPYIFEDKNEGLWVHPKGGGFSYYNMEKDELEPFFNQADDPNKKFSNILHSECIDNQGNLWFCTRSHGLEKYTFVDDKISSHKVMQPSTSSLSNNIRTIYQLKNKQIIIATKEGRVLLYSATMQLLGSISVTGDIGSGFYWPSAVYSITEAIDGTIWLGTRGNGISTLKPNNTYTAFKVEKFVNIPSDPYSLSNNNVYDIWQDTDKNMWVATLGGGINLLQNSVSQHKRFIHTGNEFEKISSENCDRIRCIIEGPNHNVFAGTSNGLLVCNKKFNQVEDIQFKHYLRSSLSENSLSNNEIMDIVTTANGDVYLATYGGGLNKVLFDELGDISGFQTFNKNQGLPSDVILSMVNDHLGNIWLTTENDLVRFDPVSETFETYPQARQLLQGNIFSESSSFCLADDRVLIGHLNGYLMFNPDSIPKNSFKPDIVLSNFQLFNKPTLHDENASFKGSIDDVKEVVLKHDQNFFNLEFAALDYVNTDQILYAYKLEGFDNDWNYTKKQRFANYTNIPNGKYLFKVKSTNGAGTWVKNERSLPITILSSFWKTPWAYALYVILFVTLFILLQRNILFIFKLKSDIKVQKQVSDMKTKFFTDISHEIRTPLTLITAPIEYLINDSATPNDIKNQLSFISQNTNRLLKLVNQILDFRKITSQKLQVSEIDLGHFTEKVCIDFMEMSHEKGMDFSFNDVSGNVKIWADKEALERVIMNLLSNAFKYCTKGDRIKVIVLQSNNKAILKVSDTGPGISEIKQKQLFKRFASFNEDASKPSTGIGLSIVKEVAELHSAQVNVKSKEGEGSTFVVTFLMGKEHFDESVEIVSAKTNVGDVVGGNVEVNKHPSIANNGSDKPTVLVVEDDVELRQFIKTILVMDYTILEAEDGEEGLEKAKSQLPDFIISDIMMPKKDGIDLLKDLRNDMTTSHIPIILLTAKSHIESKLEGINYGADDYITKPFSVAYLKARIQNLMKQRERLHSIYSNLLPGEVKMQPRPNLIAQIDEQFMDDVLAIIKENLDNNEFSVEELVRLIGLSRTTFYNKMKSLTGMSPVEFIRDHRLSHAAILITTEQLLVKEICYMTGFSDLKYFGKCFKTKYGMSPSKYRDMHKN